MKNEINPKKIASLSPSVLFETILKLDFIQWARVLLVLEPEALPLRWSPAADATTRSWRSGDRPWVALHPPPAKAGKGVSLRTERVLHGEAYNHEEIHEEIHETPGGCRPLPEEEGLLGRVGPMEIRFLWRG